MEAGTHGEVAFGARGIQGPGSGEQRLAPGLFRHLRPDMLLVWDRGLFGAEPGPAGAGGAAYVSGSQGGLRVVVPPIGEE